MCTINYSKLVNVCACLYPIDKACDTCLYIIRVKALSVAGTPARNWGYLVKDSMGWYVNVYKDSASIVSHRLAMEGVIDCLKHKWIADYDLRARILL